MNPDKTEPEKVKQMKSKSKIAYTFRTKQKARLQEFAKNDNRTVSNVVNLAVKEFLYRHEIGIY